MTGFLRGYCTWHFKEKAKTAQGQKCNWNNLNNSEIFHIHKKTNVIITITVLRIPYGWFHKFNALTKPFPVPGQQRTRVYWKWKKWKCGKTLKILFQLLKTKCSYLDTGTGNVLSMRQKDTCSTCELNCVLHSFSEQTQFSKGTYLQKTRRQIRKSIMKAKHLNTNTGETTNSDLQYFAFNSVLYVSAHSPHKMYIEG